MSTIAELERKIDKMDGAIPIDSIDFGFKNSSDYLAEKYGPTQQTIHRIEGSVPLNIEQITTISPHLHPVITKFLNGPWVQEETGHERIAGEFMRRIGVEPLLPEKEVVSLKFKIGGISSVIPSIRRAQTKLVFGRHASHERLTATVYRRLFSELKADGEVGFVETAGPRILQQEGRHLDFSRTVTEMMDAQMSPAERIFSRVLNRLTYEVVGVGNDGHRAQLGRVAALLTGGDMTVFSRPVEQISQELFNDELDDQLIIRAVRHYSRFAPRVEAAVQSILGKTHDAEFVTKSLERCFVAARAEKAKVISSKKQ
ncbi:hypothetical protein H0V99_03465 [Candidatus Saccharibacteria bacterium]|nr:hypothetical protein [Candidatus Saccharibacteria bacterium]